MKEQTIQFEIPAVSSVEAINYKRKQAIFKCFKALPFWILISGFIITIFGMTFSVLLNAFSSEWYGTILPKSYTAHWFLKAWKEYDIWSYYKVTIEITFVSTLLSLCLSIPTAYVLARKNIPLKGALISFFQFPIMLPEIVYAIPLASIFYEIGLAETIPGLIIVELLIGIPFSLVILIPFIETLDSRIEVAAQSLGANKFKLFTKIVIPQLMPGITSAAINVFIRMFSTFLTILLIAGTSTQTLPVMVFSVLQSAGSQPAPEIDSLTISLMFPLLLFTFASLWFSSYTKRKSRK
ncbi:ABC transporter permease subunit [Fodinisporobacter ferrooxydans]|uniref:ABC transporter permease subunit n=1 Tax=Fodinisporobacter ferrooxydans TaxID=2901836 RepID=A0ABY4CMZ7_9BACL|nr:ABC transporter permease subunit [Alicyclobacillaceae bacterium MYW30-H2]